MTAAAFLDLDGTLCVNASRAGQRADIVELERFSAGSTVTTLGVAARVASWTATSAWVPATTRSRDQYLRLRFPGGRPHWAIVENGATILRDGDVDRAWRERLQRDMDRDGWDPDLALRELDRLPGEWRSRGVDGAFCYATTDSDDAAAMAAAAAHVADVADRHGWAFSAQGRKCYLLPPQVAKERAARYVAGSLRADHVVAAGDSALDAGLLMFADVAIRPAHGELDHSGWSCKGLVVADGGSPLGSIELLADLVETALNPVRE